MIANSTDVENSFRDDKLVLLCFSHLRWGFVFQRPQHLMSRFNESFKVIYWEEPKFRPGIAPLLDLRTCEQNGVSIATPHLPDNMSEAQQDVALRALLDTLMMPIKQPLIRWYYTPMMLGLSRHVDASAVIYDCMDELSAFQFAPPMLVEREAQLFEDADVVFTGGRSLYEAKRDKHMSVHCFPSSVDHAHFARARGSVKHLADQADIAGPRFGYFGVRTNGSISI